MPLASLGWFRPYNEQWLHRIKDLLGRRVKNGSLLIRKWLKEAIQKEGISASRTARVKGSSAQVDELKAGVDALVQDSGMALKHQVAVELGEVAAQVMDPELSITYDVLSSNQRQILMTSTPDELVQVILDLLANTRKAQAILSLADVLGILVFIYALRGDEDSDAFTPGEEKFMMNAIVDNVMEGDNAERQWWLGDLRKRVKQMQRGRNSRSSSFEMTALKMELQDFLHERFARLKQISGARRGCRELRRLVGASNQMYVPLTRQLVSLVHQDSKLEDLSRATSVLGGLLKMGLGRLGFQSQVKPGDRPIVIVFVVGGVSMLEIREVMAEIQDQSPWKPQILLGGSCLLTGKDVTGRVWK